MTAVRGAPVPARPVPHLAVASLPVWQNITLHPVSAAPISLRPPAHNWRSAGGSGRLFPAVAAVPASRSCSRRSPGFHPDKTTTGRSGRTARLPATRAPHPAAGIETAIPDGPPPIGKSRHATRCRHSRSPSGAGDCQPHSRVAAAMFPPWPAPMLARIRPAAAAVRENDGTRRPIVAAQANPAAPLGSLRCRRVPQGSAGGRCAHRNNAEGSGCIRQDKPATRCAASRP